MSQRKKQPPEGRTIFANHLPGKGLKPGACNKVPHCFCIDPRLLWCLVGFRDPGTTFWGLVRDPPGPPGSALQRTNGRLKERVVLLAEIFWLVRQVAPSVGLDKSSLRPLPVETIKVSKSVYTCILRGRKEYCREYKPWDKIIAVSCLCICYR